MLLKLLLLLFAGDAVVVALVSVTNPPLLVFVWVVCCCCCLVHAPPLNTRFLCFGSSRCKQATKQVGAITAAAGGFCSTGCESLVQVPSLLLCCVFSKVC